MKPNDAIGQPDDELMRRAAANDDTDAFAVLVRRHQARVLGYAARMLGGDLDTAADIGQETFVRLWENRQQYELRSRLLSYLLRITHNLCVSRFRATRYTLAPLEEIYRLPGLAKDEPCATAVAVRAAILALPEEQRAVFLLSEYDGLTIQEMADALGISTGTVASRKRYAILKLRKALAAWLGGSDSEGGEAK